MTSNLDPRYQKRTIESVHIAPQMPAAGSWQRCSSICNLRLDAHNSRLVNILRLSPSLTIFCEACWRPESNNLLGINILRNLIGKDLYSDLTKDKQLSLYFVIFCGQVPYSQYFTRINWDHEPPSPLSAVSCGDRRKNPVSAMPSFEVRRGSGEILPRPPGYHETRR